MRQQGPGSLFHLSPTPTPGLLVTCTEQTEPMPGTSCGEATKVLGTGTGHLPWGLRPLLPPGTGSLRSELTHAVSTQKAQPKHPDGQCYLPSHQSGPAHTKLWLRRNRSAYLVGITRQSPHLPDTPFLPSGSLLSMKPISPGGSTAQEMPRSLRSWDKWKNYTHCQSGLSLRLKG
jgi:hypothetical protein